MKKTTSNRMGMGPLKDSSGDLITNVDRVAELMSSSAQYSTLSNLIKYLEESTRLVDEGHSVEIVYVDFKKCE